MQAAALAERESVPLLYLSGAQWCCKKLGLVNIPPAVPAKAYSGCTETYRETVMSFLRKGLLPSEIAFAVALGNFVGILPAADPLPPPHGEGARIPFSPRLGLAFRMEGVYRPPWQVS